MSVSSTMCRARSLFVVVPSRGVVLGAPAVVGLLLVVAVDVASLPTAPVVIAWLFVSVPALVAVDSRSLAVPVATGVTTF